MSNGIVISQRLPASRPAPSFPFPAYSKSSVPGRPARRSAPCSTAPVLCVRTARSAGSKPRPLSRTSKNGAGTCGLYRDFDRRATGMLHGVLHGLLQRSGTGRWPVSDPASGKGPHSAAASPESASGSVPPGGPAPAAVRPAPPSRGSARSCIPARSSIISSSSFWIPPMRPQVSGETLSRSIRIKSSCSPSAVRFCPTESCRNLETMVRSNSCAFSALSTVCRNSCSAVPHGVILPRDAAGVTGSRRRSVSGKIVTLTRRALAAPLDGAASSRRSSARANRDFRQAVASSVPSTSPGSASHQLRRRSCRNRGSGSP